MEVPGFTRGGTPSHETKKVAQLKVQYLISILIPNNDTFSSMAKYYCTNLLFTFKVLIA